MYSKIGLSCVGLLTLVLADVPGQEPLRSGVRPGTRPGPYAALVCVGPQRGQSHCFICETEDRPAVIVFARELSEPLGKLAHQIDKALLAHKGEGLRGWVTFLAEDHTTLDSKVVKWGQKHAIGALSLG